MLNVGKNGESEKNRGHPDPGTGDDELAVPPGLKE
jgi:hypothetical protein